MRQPLDQLVAHMEWADTRVVAALRRCPSDEGRRLLAHVAATGDLYFARMSGRDPWPPDTWPDLSVEASEALLARNHLRYSSLLREFPEELLRRVVRYRNDRGEEQETPIFELLLHVAVHGEHHRGQIASHVRAAGGEPAATDYIAFTHERTRAAPA